MKPMFGLLFYLLLSPLVFAHEHTNAVPEIDRKFLDNLQRPDNRPDDRRDKKSKSCCTDKDAVKVEYKLVVPDALCIRSLSGTCWIESYKPDGTPGEYKWVKVPSEKIVVEYSPSGQAYVYVIGRNIQCFVRPQARY
jgi:hypothetical protein